MKRNLSVLNNMKLISLSFYLFIGINFCIAQNNTVIIEFKDKGDINRSANTYLDQPISTNYIHQVEALGLHYKSGSDWLNMGVFNYTDANVLAKLSGLSFIKKITPNTKKQIITRPIPQDNKFQIEDDDYILPFNRFLLVLINTLTIIVVIS
jgi:acyl-CoA synthetase (AMP-forming)/AMP-acid ligase II